MYLASLLLQSLCQWQSCIITIHCMRFRSMKQPQLTIVQQQQREHYLHPVSEHLTAFNWSPSSCLLLSQYFINIYEILFTAALENREIPLAEKVKWSQAYKDLLQSQWEEWWYISAPSNVWLRRVKSLSGGCVSCVSWTWWLSLR